MILVTLKRSVSARIACMKFGRIALLAAMGVCTCCATQARAQVFVVPGTSNLWLAGMPNGSIAGNGFDTAPTQSPVQVTAPVTGGASFSFSVTGSVNNDPVDSGLSPDGGAFGSRVPGAENGIADVTAPANSLIGVFLDDSQPSLNAAPSALDFSSIGLTFSSFLPGLSQPFFIGDGQGSSGVQAFIVPAGATRLYLGTMDGFQWNNNFGSFSVTIVPAPAAASLLGLGGLLISRRRREGSV